MDQITNAFKSLTRELKRNPLESLLACILLFTGLFIYKESTAIRDLLIPTHDKEYFHESLEKTQIVNRSLELLQGRINAETLIISQFHNGSYDLTGVPFTSVTPTYVFSDNDVPDGIYNKRPLSSVNNVLYEMWKDKNNPQCYSTNINNIVKIDNTYERKLEYLDANYVIYCPLINSLDYPIGYIVAGWPTEPEINYEKEMYKFSLRIAGNLQEGVVNGN